MAVNSPGPCFVQPTLSGASAKEGKKIKNVVRPLYAKGEERADKRGDVG